MISSSNLLTWWNTPICWFFSILFLPIGLLFWLFGCLPTLFKDRKRFIEMNHWVIFTPGFYIGLFLSMMIVSPFSILYHKIKISLYEKKFHKGESGEKHKIIVEEFEKIFKDMSNYANISKNINARISIVNDKNDKVTRIHLLGNNNLNIIVFIYWNDNISMGSRYYSKDSLDFDLLRSKLFDELNKNLIERT
ncbi:hypothetical protein D3C87_78320 [compost metagenome]